MRRRLFLFAAAAFFATTPALAQDGDPVAVLRELYRVHAEGEKTKQLAWQPPHRDRFFTRNLAGMIDRAYQRNAISFDFIYDGQDFKISELSFAQVRKTANRATVEARFKNFDEPKRLEYMLVMEGGAWRIAEIRSRAKPAWTLSRVLRAG